ncbi:MAG: hypothetical protein RMJ14_00470 [Nitrososphaerota archaeon]|nr:hypothetical protein [Aigarchaeota archaeon]MDW8076103.1 hypothetical protein [Nitrososphaerota archaeon]
MSGAFILRIVGKENEERVFSNKRYYTGLRKKFEPGYMVFFVMKKDVDSFVGYGRIKDVVQLKDMEEDEVRMCVRRGWMLRIDFEESMEKFPNPIPVKQVFYGLHKLGKALHGLELTDSEVMRILHFKEFFSQR